ncbi:MAG: hypothetical protein ACI9W2_003454, partial [Gammaproteobacteria bacterium]
RRIVFLAADPSECFVANDCSGVRTGTTLLATQGAMALIHPRQRTGDCEGNRTAVTGAPCPNHTTEFTALNSSHQIALGHSKQEAPGPISKMAGAGVFY